MLRGSDTTFSDFTHCTRLLKELTNQLMLVLDRPILESLCKRLLWSTELKALAIYKNVVVHGSDDVIEDLQGSSDASLAGSEPRLQI